MKKTADDIKKEQSLSFMYFNRFLMLRYFTAFMFFTNLYWFGMALTCRSWSAVLPFLLMIGGIAVTLELTSKLHTKKSAVPVSKGYYIAQISVNLAIILISMTPAYSLFLPFLNGKGQFYVIGIALLGILMSVMVLLKIKKIANDQDRQFKVIKMFEKTNQTKFEKSRTECVLSTSALLFIFPVKLSANTAFYKFIFSKL